MGSSCKISEVSLAVVGKTERKKLINFFVYSFYEDLNPHRNHLYSLGQEVQRNPEDLAKNPPKIYSKPQTHPHRKAQWRSNALIRNYKIWVATHPHSALLVQ